MKPSWRLIFTLLGIAWVLVIAAACTDGTVLRVLAYTGFAVLLADMICYLLRWRAVRPHRTNER